MSCPKARELDNDIQSLEAFKEVAISQNSRNMVTRFSLLIHDFKELKKRHEQECQECSMKEAV